MSSQDAGNTLASSENGISGGYGGDNVNVNRAIISFTAIAWYNSIELIVLILVVFKRYRGLYFWSLLINSLAIIIYQFGAWGKLVSISKFNFFPLSFTTWGWVVMVVGQSIVLWSRLHLITQNQKLLRGILWGIIINSFVMCTPTVVLTYGSNTAQIQHYINGYAVMEKIQMTAFTVQELCISGVYLWEVHCLLKVLDRGSMRKLMWELVAINVAIILLDIALLSVEFTNLYEIEITLKGMIYSIKLKLEFNVLSKLVKIITKRQGSSMEMDEESKTEMDPSLAPLKPVYTRDTVTTFGRAPTLVEIRTNSQRNASMSAASHFLDSPTGGVTALHILQDEFITHPTALVEVGNQQTPPRSSRESSASDYYPGRLV